jgi:short-subunit dehydrogenase
VSLVSGNVLVTGATGGIGHAIARAFAARGARLTLTGRNVEALAALADELGARTLRCDLSDRAAVDELIAGLTDVDVLVANAGIPATGHITEFSPDQIDQMLDVNLRAPIMIARALAPGMIERRRGHMVFVSSLSGKAAAVQSSLYAATKFGLRGFALGIREDLRPHAVSASVVLPGFISDAGMFADANVQLPPGVGTRTPEQVAAGVLSAIERNRAEVTVAPPFLRFGTAFASVAPQTAATVQRLAGGDKIASELASKQLDKRPPA